MVEKRLGLQPYIHENCKLVNSKLGRFTEVGMCNFFENVNLGDYSYTGEFCIVQNADIGKFSSIAAMVRVGPTEHPMERPSQHHFTYRRKMYGFDDRDDEKFFAWRREQRSHIGNDTWIGHGVIIMPLVKIGNGAVVGGGAVVTKDVEPYSIVVGVPAKPVGKRFNDEIIQKLETIKWWEWSHHIIKERFNDFLLDIDSFVDKYYRK